MKKKRILKVQYLIIVVLILGVAVTRGFSLAKYTASSAWNYYLKSNGFYFSTDFTDKDTINTNWDGSHIPFKVFNYEENSITNFDINYKVTCSVEGVSAGSSECHINGTDSNIFTGTLSSNQYCSNSSYLTMDSCRAHDGEWNFSKSFSDFYFDVVPTDGEEVTSATVNVEVSSTAPFKKTINHKYILTKGKSEIGSFKLDYKSREQYDHLVVTNSYNENKCVKLSWDSSKTRIDLEDTSYATTTDSDGVINEITFTIHKKDSINLIFYRTDLSKNIDSSIFTIVESNEC